MGSRALTLMRTRASCNSPLQAGAGSHLSMAVNALAETHDRRNDADVGSTPSRPCMQSAMPEISTGHCRPISTRTPANPGKEH